MIFTGLLTCVVWIKTTTNNFYKQCFKDYTISMTNNKECCLQITVKRKSWSSFLYCNQWCWLKESVAPGYLAFFSWENPLFMKSIELRTIYSRFDSAPYFMILYIYDKSSLKFKLQCKEILIVFSIYCKWVTKVLNRTVNVTKLHSPKYYWPTGYYLTFTWLRVL